MRSTAQLEAEARAGHGAVDPDDPGPSSGMQERGKRKEPHTAVPDDQTLSTPVPPNPADFAGLQP